MKHWILPVANLARTAAVGEAWAVVHPSRGGQVYLEALANGMEKSFRSFVGAAGEDWQVIGIFASLGDAHQAHSQWIRTPPPRALGG